MIIRKGQVPISVKVTVVVARSRASDFTWTLLPELAKIALV